MFKLIVRQYLKSTKNIFKSRYLIILNIVPQEYDTTNLQHARHNAYNRLVV